MGRGCQEAHEKSERDQSGQEVIGFLRDQRRHQNLDDLLASSESAQRRVHEG